MVVVEPVIAFERGLQIRPRVESMCVKHIAHAAVETLDHAIGLRPVRRDQPMFDAMLATEPIYPVPAAGHSLASGGEAVGKGLAVVRQQGPDPERRPLTNVLQKTSASCAD